MNLIHQVFQNSNYRISLSDYHHKNPDIAFFGRKEPKNKKKQGEHDLVDKSKIANALDLAKGWKMAEECARDSDILMLLMYHLKDSLYYHFNHRVVYFVMTYPNTKII